MALIEIVREVRLPQQEVWNRLTDWSRHADFVPLTSIHLTHTGFIGRTGFGRFSFDDPMEITRWEPPELCRLEKRGRVVSGWAELRVVALDLGSRVVWREDIHLTGTPRLLDTPTRAVSRKLFGRVIDGLLAG